ncbi:MAG: choice-of-anchor B family protein [Planctomycetota bacterium]|jgi:choice-of-anchor B domain-containing protein|nr:choice-of-anchor B family protein [Planctomycetota bacterium]MDP6763817.1 choice-of-anchor B family protein [Planctomycetota bacterium]MDP6989683.1 choice-of-anchor B family protein [Planctomycetota bacterium]
MSSGHRLIFAAALCALAPAATFAHDDDPKVNVPPNPRPGPGYRNALVSTPGANAGNIQMGGGGFLGNGIVLLAQVPLSAFGSNAGNDCWGYTSPSGREYAIMCTGTGTSFVDLSNPTNPVVVANMDGVNSVWRDCKTYDTYAYSVNEDGDGIQVFDLSNIDNGQVTLVNTTNQNGTTATHNVAINTDSGYLYRCGGSSNGLRIYDLSNPVNPQWVANWGTRYVHDVQVVTYTTGPYAGREIAFCCTGSWVSLTILDVTNKSNIFQLSNIQYPNNEYSHQGWLSPDKQYFYLADELDEDGSFPSTTYVIDVSNLNSPFVASSFDNGLPSITHNLYQRGNLIFEANYTSGLRIFDATNPLSPTEIASYDTFPAGNGASFNGLWSCYPFYDSDLVIGSDTNGGLFVWSVNNETLSFSYPNGRPEYFDPGGEAVWVNVTESQAGVYAPGTALLHVNAGSGYVSIPMTDLGNGLFEAPFPAMTCGTGFDYYVSADSTGGITFADPADAPMTAYSGVAAYGAAVVAEDDVETNQGWTVGAPADDATTGIWTRVDPIGTDAQPEDDHTPAPGTMAWVTGQGSNGGSVGENDVDGGQTTLLSPIYDLSGASAPIISYWRWFHNSAGASPNNDVLEVGISNNGGASWVTVEVVGPDGNESNGGWFQHSFNVADIVAPTASVRLRFVASDEGFGSIVEAAVDDIAIEDVDCGGCGTTSYCVAAPNSSGSGALITSSGDTSITANTFTLEILGATPGQPGLFYYGPNEVQIPFGEGFRCVGGTTFRLNPAQNADAFGDTSRLVDFTQFPACCGPGAISAGDTWKFQFWYRDPTGGLSGFNLSDGLSAVFCP